MPREGKCHCIVLNRFDNEKSIENGNENLPAVFGHNPVFDKEEGNQGPIHKRVAQQNNQEGLAIRFGKPNYVNGKWQQLKEQPSDKPHQTFHFTAFLIYNSIQM